MYRVFKELFTTTYFVNKKPVYYIHNLSNFDVSFMLEAILDYNPKICYSNDRNLGFNINLGKDLIRFRDSYLFLNAGLRKLPSIFGLANKKGIFPYKFVTRDKLDYVGSGSIGLYDAASSIWLHGAERIPGYWVFIRYLFVRLL